MARGIRLNERDHRILRHVQQYGLTTVDALHALCFASRAAAKSTLRRLCQTGEASALLESTPLDSRRVCYRLTKSGAKLIGERQYRDRPLGLRARAERYAILWYVCIDQPGTRSLFNPREFPEQFEIGPHRLPRARFCLEQTKDDQVRLGFLMIDYQSDPRRIIRRTTHTVGRFLEHGWFDAYLKARAMQLVLLTASNSRGATLRQQIQRHWKAVLPREAVLPVLVTAPVPGLADILAHVTPRERPNP